MSAPGAEASPPPARNLTVRTPGWLRWLRRGEVNAGDGLFRTATSVFAAGILLVLLLMTYELAVASEDSLAEFGPGFVVGTNWDPVHEIYGALPFIFGTVVSSLVALVIAVPIALGIAIFLAELAPRRLARPLGFGVELIAAVPSVVFGLWGIFALAPWMRESVQPLLKSWLGWLPLFTGTPRGFGMLTAGVVLAIMILPTIASISRDVLRAVPDTQREGALALGATRWETVRHAVLPMARSGIVGAIILGLGRALGETMAVTMVIGNRSEISWSLLDPSYTMASVIANEYAEASTPLHLSALTEIGLLLFAVTLLLNVGARLLVWRVARMPKGARA